jgi:ribulose-5-phosphate 4-epimerase/fuculose-1-phosphate aldolase
MSKPEAPEEEELKKEIIQFMISLHQRGLTTGIGGNASIRLPSSNEVWITPSGVYKPWLKADDLVKIDMDGNVIEGLLKPSTEWYIHTGVYKKRADVNAVVHTHNPIATGLALSGVTIKPITLEAALMLPRVPIVPFFYPGTKELGEAVSNSIMGNRILMLQNHGVLAVGYDMIEAVSAVELLEECATMMWVASHFGEPRALPAHDMELIKKLYKI